MLGKSTKRIVGLSGFWYSAGSVVSVVTSTFAAPSSSSLSLNKLVVKALFYQIILIFSYS